MPTKKRVDIGMIGAGWWPNTMHMPALAACDLANVVAVCDLIPERADVLAQKYDIPYNFTDYKELLASGLCEAVVVATTNDSHYPITMDALEHGLHVLCEKPLALNYAQAPEMAATVRKKGLVTCVPFTYRYMPSMRYLKQLIDRAIWDGPITCTCATTPPSPATLRRICGVLNARSPVPELLLTSARTS